MGPYYRKGLFFMHRSLGYIIMMSLINRTALIRHFNDGFTGDGCRESGYNT